MHCKALLRVYIIIYNRRSFVSLQDLVFPMMHDLRLKICCKLLNVFI